MSAALHDSKFLFCWICTFFKIYFDFRSLNSHQMASHGFNRSSTSDIPHSKKEKNCKIAIFINDVNQSVVSELGREIIQNCKIESKRSNVP